MDIARFGVEIALTRLVEENNIRCETVELRDPQPHYERRKAGILEGIIAHGLKCTGKSSLIC